MELDSHFGKYEVSRHLRERGDYVDVYEAFLGNERRPVELHILRHRVSEKNPDFQRFLNEFQTLSSLTHPHVVKFLDFGILEDRVFYATVATGAQTLEEIVDSGKRFGVVTTVELGRQMAVALGYLHENKIIHRNIGPDSIFWNIAQKQAILGGFALVKNFKLINLTVRGIKQPTEPRMTPEKYHRQEQDERTDLYLLGGVLYWLLTGKPAITVEYDEMKPELILCTTPPSHVNPDIPESLDSLVMKLLQENPAKRFSDAGKLESALDEAKLCLTTMG